MQKSLKKNIKFLCDKYPITKILGIKEQSLNNKIYDSKRKFSLEDVILIHQATKIKFEDLIFSDLSKQN